MRILADLKVRKLLNADPYYPTGRQFAGGSAEAK